MKKSWEDINEGLEQISNLDNSYLLKKATEQRIKEVSKPVVELQQKLKTWLKRVKSDNREMVKRIKEGKVQLLIKNLKKLIRKKPKNRKMLIF